MLEAILIFDPTQNEGLWGISVKIVAKLVDVISRLKMLQPSDELLSNVETFKTSLELTLSTDDPFYDLEYDKNRIKATKSHGSSIVRNHMCALLNLTAIQIELPGMLDNGDIVRYLKRLLSRRERRDERGMTLLHLACYDFRGQRSCYTWMEVILFLLLEAKADPTSVDDDGNTPLTGQYKKGFG